MRKRSLLPIILFMFVILAIFVVSLSSTLSPTSGQEYTVPGGQEDVSYGAWGNTVTYDGSCNPTQCWGTGINDRQP